MKKYLAAFIGLSLASGIALAERVRDWRDLDEVHKHTLEAIHEMERARAANHYDLEGHGEKAEAHLRDAERELNLAIEAARRH